MRERNDASLIRRRCSYVGADISPTGLRRATGSALRLVCADEEQLPFAGESFDATISTFALEHCVNPVQMLQEMHRVVRPGGRIAATGQGLVLKEHTYHRRVGTFLELIEGAQKKRWAPARSWAEERVRLAYLEYFALNEALGCAWAELPAIAQRNLAKALAGSVVIARAWGGEFRGGSGTGSRARLAWMDRKHDVANGI